MVALKAKLRAKMLPAEKKLRDHALGFPGATDEFPWGSRAIKGGGKAFVFRSSIDGRLWIGTKLPKSKATALNASFASLAHYGLGRHGWATCEFTPAERVPLELPLKYVEESDRAVGPKRLVAELEAR